LPAAMVALGAVYRVKGPHGERDVTTRDFYEGAYSTALRESEILVSVRLPMPADDHGYAYEKQKRKVGDYATASAAVVLTMSGGACTSAAIAPSPAMFKPYWLMRKSCSRARRWRLSWRRIATLQPTVDLVEVDYDELPALVDPTKSMSADAPVLRDDLKDTTNGAHGPRKHHNHVFAWEVGDAEGTARALSEAAVVAKERVVYQRVHPCPLETCGCVASMDKVNGHLTIWGTSQAPHAVRTVASLISGIPEHKIRIISPDIGGGFGNKVGVYPGYICSIVASIVLGVPVKWVEDRMENLQATAFARDYHMTGEIAATREGRITGLRCHVLADHGAFDACADPIKYPAGFFSICTGSYDIPVAHVTVDGVYTNKAPGGVAYRCSFRVTEASYFIERMIDVLARKLDLDPAEIRRRNLIRKEQFPYHSALGWEYDSGDSRC
jgi:aerobic carbon-monoxide dehydrogenase large subunit